jgi:hypothetical protein
VNKQKTERQGNANIITTITPTRSKIQLSNKTNCNIGTGYFSRCQGGE